MIARQTIFYILLLACYLAGAVAPAKAANVIGLSMAQKTDAAKTRITIELDKQAEYRLETGGDPKRLLIDFANTSWQLRNPQKSLPKLIGDFRFGQYRSGVLRVAFDITKGFKIDKYGILPGRIKKSTGMRLWVDITADNNFTAQKFTSKKWDSQNKEDSATIAGKLLGSTIPRNTNDGRNVVVIDPGHGGRDPGAIGAGGRYEKHLVLEVAKELKKELEKLGHKAYLTRDKDVAVQLRERFYLAESVGADVFISLHADKFSDKRVNGGAIYTLSEDASDEESELLAIAENKSDIIAGYSLNEYSSDVSRILIGLAQISTNRKSKKLAKNILKVLEKTMKMRSNPMRTADFAVLKSPNVPSLMLELGFLSNPDDEKRIASKSFQRKVAKGLALGIERYLKVK